MTQNTTDLDSKGTLDKLSTLDKLDQQAEGRKWSILVIEDSPIIQNMIRPILAFQQYDLTFTQNGDEALQFCRENKYDLILMDLAMPVLDGVACVKSIRAMEDKDKAKTPVIAVTGNSEDYTPEEFIHVGFDAFHPKPIDFDKLSKQISGHLNSTAGK